jgi:hypothetical protein
MQLEINQQIEDLFNLEVNLGSYTFNISGTSLPVRFTSLKTSKLLLLGFHAALDRKSNHPPAFTPFQVKLSNAAKVEPNYLVHDPIIINSKDFF